MTNDITNQERMDAWIQVNEFIGAIRSKTLRNLVLIALVWLVEYRDKGNRYQQFLIEKEEHIEPSWVTFKYDLKIEDVQGMLHCSKRTAWDYKEAYLKLASLF